MKINKERLKKGIKRLCDEKKKKNLGLIKYACF